MFTAAVCRSKKVTDMHRNKTQQQRVVGRVQLHFTADMDIHNPGSLSAAARSENQPVPLLYQGESLTQGISIPAFKVLL